jgi:hypothetical protein
MWNSRLFISRMLLSTFFAISAIFAYTMFLQFFTEFHSMQHGDSLMLSIMSYTKPTLYFWGENYYLNFIPMLFSFIRNPYYNLLLITSFQLSMVFILPYLVCKVLSIEDIYLFVMIVIFCLATFFTSSFWLELCIQCYVPAFLLATVSLWLFSGFRSTAKALSRPLLLLLSSMFALIALKVSQPIVVVFLIWGLYSSFDNSLIKKQENELRISIEGAKKGARDFLVLIFLCIFSILIFSMFERFYFRSNPVPTRNILMSFDVWSNAASLKSMLINMYSGYLADQPMLFILAVSFCFFYAILVAKKEYLVIGKSLFLFLVPGMCIAVMMASLEWVRQNMNMARYIIISILLIVMNLSYLAVESARTFNLSIHIRSIITYSLLVSICIALPYKFNIASFMSPPERIIRQFNLNEQINCARTLDGAIGNYWKVWPTVWSVNSGGQVEFFGVSDRSWNILDIINNKLQTSKQLKLLGYKDDPDVHTMINRYFKNSLIRRYDVGSLSIIQIISVPVADRSLADEAFQAELSIVDVPISLTVKSNTKVKVRIKNISKLAWLAKGELDGRYWLNVSYHWLDSQSVPVVFDGKRTAMPHDVKSNETITLEADVVAPSITGNYILEIDLVQEAAAWFKDKGSSTVKAKIAVY